MRPIRDVAREQREYRRKQAREKYLAKFKQYKTPYHDIRSDQSTAISLEAAARMKTMVETYLHCSKAYCGKIEGLMPFVICKDSKDYYSSGGVKRTTCVRVKDNLLAYIADDTEYDWKTLQYEGYRQFSRAVVSRKLPLWVDRGLAVYFSNSVWAADEYVTGFISNERLVSVKKYIADGEMLPFLSMMYMKGDKWAGTKGRNEIQAWSMVHFLMHAENGKYRAPFEKSLKAIVNKKLPIASFRENFGKNFDALQKGYEKWWISLPENPTADKATIATVRTLTNFLALAWHKKKSFGSIEAFVDRIRCDGQIDMATEPCLWLPKSLLEKAIENMGDIACWSLDNTGARSALVMEQPDGTTFTGTYSFAKGKPKVEVKIIRPTIVKNAEVKKK